MIVRRLAATVLLLVSVVGCSRSDGAKTAQIERHRSQFLLNEEPEGIQGILEYREASAPAGDVVLFGRVGGIQETWSPGAAAFVICDPTSAIAADDGHVCKDGCAFCKKTKQNELDSQVIVQFTDDQGQVLPIDARKLFPLEEKQTVVVQGTASVDSVGNLILSARGIYIRR